MNKLDREPLLRSGCCLSGVGGTEPEVEPTRGWNLDAAQRGSKVHGVIGAERVFEDEPLRPLKYLLIGGDDLVLMPEVLLKQSPVSVTERDIKLAFTKHAIERRRDFDADEAGNKDDMTSRAPTQRSDTLGARLGPVITTYERRRIYKDRRH